MKNEAMAADEGVVEAEEGAAAPETLCRVLTVSARVFTINSPDY